LSENLTDPKLAKAEAAAARAKARALRPWYQKKRFIIPGALVAIIAFSSAANTGNSDNHASTPAGAPSSDGVNAVPTEQPSAALTLGQENAIESAKSYLDSSGFSRKGLLHQLTSEYGEGFEKADAEFALAYLEQNSMVDWNAEAVESAKSYLESSSFSKNSLYEQLTSEYGEQFTPEQAKQALTAVGY
jgi:hypothetical protein